MSNWVEMRLSEIAEINPHEVLKKGAVAKKVPMDKLQPYCRDIPEFIIEPYSGGAKFRNGDTIMARITPCLENGKIAQVNILDGNEVGFGSTEYIVFRARKGNDADFIYYLVSSSLVKEPAIKSMVGSSGRQRVQIDVIQNLLLKVPELKTQRAIASILKGLDDKIGENNKVNHNLQQQAKAIFDEWFIKIPQSTQDTLKITSLGYFPDSFSVVKTGELPIVVADYVANGSFASLKENVKLYQSKNYAYFIRNTDLKSGSFEVFVDKHSYDFLSKSRLLGGEIIISNVGDVGSVFLCPTLDAPMTLGNNIIMIKSDIPELRLFLYIWFKWSLGQGLIQGIKSGSAQPKFNKTDFKNLPIILPPSELLQKFNSTVSPIFEMIERNDNENRKLSSLRDSILPKLMSGEIDVSEVEV